MITRKSLTYAELVQKLCSKLSKAQARQLRHFWITSKMTEAQTYQQILVIYGEIQA